MSEANNSDNKDAAGKSAARRCSAALDKKTVNALKRALRQEPHLLARAERKAKRAGITLDAYLQGVIAAVRLLTFV